MQVRLSVGLEDPKDLKADIEQALRLVGWQIRGNGNRLIDECLCPDKVTIDLRPTYLRSRIKDVA